MPTNRQNIDTALQSDRLFRRPDSTTWEGDFNVARDRFNNIIERDFTGADQSAAIDKSIRNLTPGLLEVQVDASTSVLNNFLSVGTGDQTVDRLIPRPSFFREGRTQSDRFSYEFSGQQQNSVGSVNFEKDQGGILTEISQPKE